MIIDWLSAEQTLNYGQVSAAALFFTDWMMELSNEVEYIWKKRGRRSINLVYLVNRYLPIVDTSLGLAFCLAPNLRPSTCIKVAQARDIMAIVGMVVAELILMIRTHALYGQSRESAIFLVTFGVAMLTVVSTCTGLYIINVPRNINAPPFVIELSTSCITNQSGSFMMGSWAALLATEIVIFSLTVRQGLRNWRLVRAHALVIPEEKPAYGYSSSSPLMRTLYRDGVIFCLYLMLFSTVNIILVSRNPVLGVVFPLFTRILHSIIACRVILHLRRAAADTYHWAAHAGDNLQPMDDGDHDGDSVDVLSTIHFRRVSVLSVETGGGTRAADHVERRQLPTLEWSKETDAEEMPHG